MSDETQTPTPVGTQLERISALIDNAPTFDVRSDLDDTAPVAVPAPAPEPAAPPRYDPATFAHSPPVRQLANMIAQAEMQLDAYARTISMPQLEAEDPGQAALVRQAVHSRAVAIAQAKDQLAAMVKDDFARITAWEGAMTAAVPDWRDESIQARAYEVLAGYGVTQDMAALALTVPGIARMVRERIGGAQSASQGASQPAAPRRYGPADVRPLARPSGPAAALRERAEANVKARGVRGNSTAAQAAKVAELLRLSGSA